MENEITPTINQTFIENRPLSSSSIKAFRRSPKHYIDYLIQPRVEIEAFIVGNLVDIMLLTPERFEKKVYVYQKPNLRTKDGRAEMEIIQAKANKNRMILATEGHVQTATKCKESVMSLDTSRELIEGKIKAQVELKWRHKKLNLPCIGYADLETNAWGEHWVVDLKTSKNADPDMFVRDALKYGYDIQAGAYLDAYHKIKYQFPYFIFLVVETAPPYNVSVNFCDSTFVEQAKKEWLGSLAAFRYCMDNNLFRMGYEFRLQQANYFSLNYPNWHKPLFANFNIENQ